jgi:hypothetical protein
LLTIYFIVMKLLLVLYQQQIDIILIFRILK